jgi:hypothetical protein
LNIAFIIFLYLNLFRVWCLGFGALTFLVLKSWRPLRLCEYILFPNPDFYPAKSPRRKVKDRKAVSSFPEELRVVSHDPVFERYSVSAEGLPSIIV